MNNLNIVLIYSDYLGKQNGSNTHIRELHRALKLNNNVILIAPKPFDYTIVDDSIDFIHVPKFISQSKVFFHFFYQVLLFIKLLKLRTKINPNFIYSRLDGFSISPVIFAKMYRIPLFVEVNGLFIDQINVSDPKNRYSKIIVISEKINYKYCDVIIAVTRGLKESLINMYSMSPKKIVVVENGVNIKLFRPIDIITSKQKVKLDLNKRYVCFVGHLVIWQGIEYLVQASKIVCKEMPDVYFLIVGDGEIKSSLLDLAKTIGANNLVFTGRVPYEEVPYYINSSEICVAPFIVARNYKIGLSALKIYEYLACAKPVIASNIPGVKELLENSRGGIVVQSENYNELANAILNVLRTQKIMQDMGKDGRFHVETMHTWDSAAKQIENIYMNLICEKTRFV